MCTVTYIPTQEGFLFTSSRDEQVSRATLAPQRYKEQGLELIYPKDELAGGTWIAASANGRTACLLNGAFEKHIPKGAYAKSRGLILLESFKYKNAREFQEQIDLQNIEPFTLIMLAHSNGKLSEFDEFRWDGEKKHFKNLSNSTCQIWSSATLYGPEAQKIRTQLFENWIEQHKLFPDKEIINFHNRKHGLKSNEDIIMKGLSDLRTLSISQIQLNHQGLNFKYTDLVNDKESSIRINNREILNA